MADIMLQFGGGHLRLVPNDSTRRELDHLLTHHPRRSLVRTLLPALQRVRGHYRTGRRATVAELIEPLGEEGPAFGAILLSVPFCIPFSTGPIATMVGIVVFMFGLQMYRGHEHRVLPARLLAVRVPPRAYRMMRGGVARLARFRRSEECPGLSNDHRTPPCMRTGGIGILLGGILLGTPIPMVPPTSVLPSLGIIFFALYTIKRRRMFVALGITAHVLTVLMFAFVALAAIYGTGEVVEWIGLQRLEASAGP